MEGKLVKYVKGLWESELRSQLELLARKYENINPAEALAYLKECAETAEGAVPAKKKRISKKAAAAAVAASESARASAAIADRMTSPPSASIACRLSTSACH